MKYHYDNEKRVALSKHTWKRLKQFKKFNKCRTMEECIIQMLDEIEYGIGRGC